MSKSLPYRYIAVEGNIGAGKTSLASILSAKFNTLLALEEFADNTFLPQFYQNPERFAFPLELSFLAERYQQLKQKIDESRTQQQILVTDYLFEKSLLFARVNLKDEELKLFTRFYELIKESLPKPDLVIYLEKTTPQLSANIAKRGRSYEKEISNNYLQSVSQSYHQHLQAVTDIPVLFFESDKLDFVNNASHLNYILSFMQTQHRQGFQRINE